MVPFSPGGRGNVDAGLDLRRHVARLPHVSIIQVRAGIRAKDRAGTNLFPPPGEAMGGAYPVAAVSESERATFAPMMRPKVLARNTDVCGCCLCWRCPVISPAA